MTLARPMGRRAPTGPLSVADLRARILAPGEQVDVLGDPVVGRDRAQSQAP
ncbi:hypothetical protein D3C87_2030610 [compost metagenome]